MGEIYGRRQRDCKRRKKNRGIDMGSGCGRRQSFYNIRIGPQGADTVKNYMGEVYNVRGGKTGAGRMRKMGQINGGDFVAGDRETV